MLPPDGSRHADVLSATPGSMSSIKRDVKKKSSASTGGEICFSRSSPLELRFSGEVWPIVHSHEFLSLMVTMPSGLRERQAKLVLKVNHGSIRGSWPMAISGYPRGHNVKWVTRCQAHGADLID